jgi:hypothetical protein
MHMVGRNQIYTANARHFWGEITDYTVVYGVHIQFWPTLLIHVTHFTHVAHFTHIAHFTHVADCTILISVFSAGTVCLHHSGQLFHIRCSFHARCWLHISYFCVQCRYSLISVFISYFCVHLLFLCSVQVRCVCTIHVSLHTRPCPPHSSWTTGMYDVYVQFWLTFRQGKTHCFLHSSENVGTCTMCMYCSGQLAHDCCWKCAANMDVHVHLQEICTRQNRTCCPIYHIQIQCVHLCTYVCVCGCGCGCVCVCAVLTPLYTRQNRPPPYAIRVTGGHLRQGVSLAVDSEERWEEQLKQVRMLYEKEKKNNYAGSTRMQYRQWKAPPRQSRKCTCNYNLGKEPVLLPSITGHFIVRLLWLKGFIKGANGSQAG